MMRNVVMGCLSLLIISCTPSETKKNEASAVSVENAASDAFSEAASIEKSVVPQDEKEDVLKQPEGTWLSYQCEDNKDISARYQKNVAELRWQGKVMALKFDELMSNDDLTTFSNQEYSWTISNQGLNDYYQEENGFLVSHSSENLDGMESIVDTVVLQECMPKYDSK